LGGRQEAFPSLPTYPALLQHNLTRVTGNASDHPENIRRLTRATVAATQTGKPQKPPDLQAKKKTFVVLIRNSI